MSNLNNNRFVILYHEIPANGSDGTSAEDYANRKSHWDFMLADGDHLLTWAVEKKPEPGTTSNAIQLPNHRLTYLDYEGEISGGRGCVTQLAKGTYEWVERTQEQVVVVLECALLNKIELVRGDGDKFECRFW